jgi:hypothetical protein
MTGDPKFLASQTNGTNVFQEAQWLIFFIHFTEAFGYPNLKSFGRDKNENLSKCDMDMKFSQIYVRLASVYDGQTARETYFENSPKARCRKEACSMHASFVSVHIIAWHFNVWGFTDHVPLNFNIISTLQDRLCGLVVRVLGYRFGGPGFDSQALQDFPKKKERKKKKGKQVVGLERGSLSLVSTTEELLDRKVAAPV